MDASDNGYDGADGIKTNSYSIQVAVAGVNDAPVVVPAPPGRAVPGETEAFAGFLVLDPDTDTDGRIAEAMIKVFLRQFRGWYRLCCSKAARTERVQFSGRTNVWSAGGGSFSRPSVFTLATLII